MKDLKLEPIETAQHAGNDNRGAGAEGNSSAPASPTVLRGATKRKSMLIRKQSHISRPRDEVDRRESPPTSPLASPAAARQGSYNSHMDGTSAVVESAVSNQAARSAHASSASTPPAPPPITPPPPHTQRPESLPPPLPAHPLTSGPFSVTQSSPTALPDELLELIREFRVRTERVAALVGPEGYARVQQLHHSGNDIIRYVTNFLIQKHEEEVRYEQKKLMGWSSTVAASIAAATTPTAEGAAKRHSQASSPAKTTAPIPRAGKPPKHSNGADATPLLEESHRRSGAIEPNVFGPFLLTTLYGVLEALLYTLRCDRARIFLPDGPALLAVVTVGGGAVIPPQKADWHRIAGTVFRSGVALHIGDTSKAPPHLSSSADDSRAGYLVRNVLCLPLLSILADDTGASIVAGGDGGAKPSDKQHEVLGVLEFMNKQRSDAFVSGFTEDDEAAAQHYASLISSLMCWGRGSVDLCNNTSTEEGARLQRLILSQQHFATHLRTQSIAGSKSVTRTEAAQLIHNQTMREHRQSILLEEARGGQHPFLLAAERRSHAQRTTLIYRVACKHIQNVTSSSTTEQSPHAQPKKGEARTAFVALEAASLIERGGNVRELVQMLEQFDSLWKSSRHLCITLEEKVDALEAELRCERMNTRSLHQLCISCGITPPPVTQAHLLVGAGVDPSRLSDTISEAGPSLVDSGTVDSTIGLLHQRTQQRLKYSASRATNLEKRIAATTHEHLRVPIPPLHLSTSTLQSKPSMPRDEREAHPPPARPPVVAAQTPSRPMCQAQLDRLLRKLENSAAT